MACQRFAAAIRGHALGAPLAAEAAAHLSACPVCRSTFDAERRVLATIDEALADVAAAAPSAHFVSRLRAHVEVASGHWAPHRWLIPAVAAAITLLAVALIVPRFSPERADPREASSVRPPQVPPAASARSPIEDANAAVPVATVPRARRGHARTLAAIRPAAAPEVLVPERERAAVGRLFASLRTGRPEVVSMLMRLRGGEALTDAQAVTIEPLRIDPVVVSELPGAAAIVDK
jgi:hypothetical protein